METQAEGISLYCENVAISWDLKDNKVFKARTVALLYQCLFKIMLCKTFSSSADTLNWHFFLKQNFISSC